MRSRALALAALAAAGCGYTSEYVAPIDGRPRAVWQEDHVAVESAGAPLGPACLGELGLVSGADRLHLVAGDLRLQPPSLPGAAPFVIVAAGFWGPRYYGPPIVPPLPGVAPLLPHPPLFLPPPLLRVPHPRPVIVGPPRPGGGGGPNLGDDGKLWVALAAVTLVVMPAVALGLALARPEDSDANAEAIDQVNAYNDLLRTAGSPCAVFAGGPS